MVHIPFKDALTHACLPQLAAFLRRQNQNLRTVLKLPDPDDAKQEVLDNMGISVGQKDQGAVQYKDFIDYIEGISAGNADAVAAALDGIVKMVEDGIWIPLRLVVARPFIEHEMFSAIMMVGGADTGNTLLGPSDFQVSANTTVKTIEGHYTCAATPLDSARALRPSLPCCAWPDRRAPTLTRLPPTLAQLPY